MSAVVTLMWQNAMQVVQGVPGQSQLHSELKVSLNLLRLCPQTNKQNVSSKLGVLWGTLIILVLGSCRQEDQEFRCSRSSLFIE